MQQLLKRKESPARTRSAEEVSLRVGASGYGGAPLRGVSRAGRDAGREDAPGEAKVGIRVPGYGWRVVGVRDFSRDLPDGTGSVALRVPGYGRAPSRMVRQETRSR